MPSTTLPGDDARSFAARLATFERRLAAVESGVRLRDATIDAPGVLRIRDADGDLRAALGLLASGRVGLATYDDTGAEIAAAADVELASEVGASAAYADLATPGPEIAVSAAATGLLLVAMSCRMSPQAAATGGFMTVRVSAVDDAAQLVAPADVNALELTTAARCSRLVLLTGLPSESLLVTAKYRVADAANGYLFDDRAVIAVPL